MSIKCITFSIDASFPFSFEAGTQHQDKTKEALWFWSTNGTCKESALRVAILEKGIGTPFPSLSLSPSLCIFTATTRHSAKQMLSQLYHMTDPLYPAAYLSISGLLSRNEMKRQEPFIIHHLSSESATTFLISIFLCR